MRGGRKSTTLPIRERDAMGRFECNKCKNFKYEYEYPTDNTTYYKIHSYCKVCVNKMKKRKRPFNSSIIGFYEDNCLHCNSKFITKSAIKMFCNAKCKYQYTKKQREKECTIK